MRGCIFPTVTYSIACELCYATSCGITDSRWLVAKQPEPFFHNALLANIQPKRICHLEWHKTTFDGNPMEISHREKYPASRVKMTLFFIGSGLFFVGSASIAFFCCWQSQGWGHPITKGLLDSSSGYVLSLILFLMSIGYCAKALYWMPREGEMAPSQNASNQLPDPTSPSVTSPAGAGGAPSLAADH